MKLPKIAQKGPYIEELEEGQLYSWCTCGLSQTQPFCDGSHKGITEMKSLKFVPEKSGTVFLCGCKQTKNPPYCDGSHNALD